MSCWTANIVGAFFLSLVIYDLVKKEYEDLPYHGGIGILLTLLYWGLCNLGGDALSGSALVIPALFIGVFLFTVWFTGESMKKRGCCIRCIGQECKEPKSCKAILVKKNNISSEPKQECIDFNLNAKPVI
jgi:hypothetical protein